ncbi:MAG: hypothetical protein M1829_004075 [Trizodia sp. TS-e1964]|nr:MAG: hypothetical protein M1829_004075 [Trizodia sp. TS-e1964]
MSPPSGPSTAPMSMSAHNRVSHPDSSGPVYSRAGPSNGSYPSRERQFSQSSAGRGRRYSESYTNPNDVPTGPRGSNNGPTYPAPFRGSSNNSTSTTYPRTQRFSTHLASLPAIVPGGKLLPSSIDRSVQEKLAKLEAEQKKLEQDLAEKIAKKRQGLRTWDKLSRESSRENLRGDLAEQQARSIVGDAGSSGPAF